MAVSCIWGVLINIANIFYQLEAIFTSPSVLSKVVNVLYSIGTIISLTLFGRAYYKKNANLIFPAFAIVALRNTVRMLDIE